VSHSFQPSAISKDFYTLASVFHIWHSAETGSHTIHHALAIASVQR